MVEVDLGTRAFHAASHPSALASKVAEQALAIGFDDIPADVGALAKIHFLDQLGIGLVASTLPQSPTGEFDCPRLRSPGDGCGGGASQRHAHALARI